MLTTVLIWMGTASEEDKQALLRKTAIATTNLVKAK